MPSFKGHLPLAVVSIALAIAVYILFKELRAVKNQAAIGANFATAFQEQQQQQLQMFQQMPPQFIMEPPPVAEPLVDQKADAAETEEDGTIEDLDVVQPPRPKSSKLQKRQ